MPQIDGAFDTLSQRVAWFYLRSLGPIYARFEDPMEDSRSELRNFYHDFYAYLFANPGQFDLPLGEDDYLVGDEKNTTERKAELNRKLARPRDSIAAGVDFLQLAGSRGELTRDSAQNPILRLSLDDYAQYVKKSRSRKPFLNGMQAAGLEILETPEGVTLRHPRFPGMLLALQALAKACDQISDPKLARFCFSRSDYSALTPGYIPHPLDLYRMFDHPTHGYLQDMHGILTDRGYKAIVGIYGMFGWQVEYQGRREVKSTPILRLEYSQRHLQPLRIEIKFATTARLIPLLPQQPRSLQADYFNRAIQCGSCDWCRNSKTLGPSILEFEGQQKKSCWFGHAELAGLTQPDLQLIEGYTNLHEQLA